MSMFLLKKLIGMHSLSNYVFFSREFHIEEYNTILKPLNYPTFTKGGGVLH